MFHVSSPLLCVHYIIHPFFSLPASLKKRTLYALDHTRIEPAIRLFFLDDHFLFVFVNGMGRDLSPDTGKRIDIRVPADDRARIEDAVASDLHMIAQHGAEFFSPVSICSAPFLTTTSVLSDFTLDVIDPAPMWEQ